MGTVSLGSLAVIESALDLTRPGKANEGDELGLACISNQDLRTRRLSKGRSESEDLPIRGHQR